VIDPPMSANKNRLAQIISRLSATLSQLSEVIASGANAALAHLRGAEYVARPGVAQDDATSCRPALEWVSLSLGCPQQTP